MRETHYYFFKEKVTTTYVIVVIGPVIEAVNVYIGTRRNFDRESKLMRKLILCPCQSYFFLQVKILQDDTGK